MPFACLDDNLWSDPALLGVSYPARWLYIALISYSAQKLTDGHVDERAMRLVATASEMTPDELCQYRAELLQRGLLVSGEAEIVIVGYHERHRNRTRDRVEADRQSNAERQAAWREKHARKKPR